MKYLFGLLLSLGLISLCSCSNQDNAISTDVTELTIQSQEHELAALRAKILNYNENVQQSNYTRGKGKTGKKKWWKWLLVGVSDAIGAAVGGGVVGAVGTSAIAGVALSADIGSVNGVDVKAPRRALKRSSEYMYSSIIVDNHLYQENYDDSIGYYHNIALEALLNDSTNVMMFNNAEGDSKMYMINSIMTEICGRNMLQNLSAYDRTVIYNKGNAIANIAVSSDTLEDFIQGIRGVSENLGLSQSEIDVLEAYFDGLSEVVLDDDESIYMNDILSYTDQCNIPSEMKVTLGNIMIVANASMKLWSNTYLAEEE